MIHQLMSTRINGITQALGPVLISLSAVHHLGVHAAHADHP
jgi:hypothetical protein